MWKKTPKCSQFLPAFSLCICIRYSIHCCLAQSICYKDVRGRTYKYVSCIHMKRYLSQQLEITNPEKVLLWLTSSFPANSLEDKNTTLDFCFAAASGLIHLLIASKNATHTVTHRVWIGKSILASSGRPIKIVFYYLSTRSFRIGSKVSKWVAVEN